MSIEFKLRVAEIQRFCMHDGPGIRTTVFLKGCPLSCRWCHNPETKVFKKELLFYENKCINCGICTQCAQKVHLINEEHSINRRACIQCGECAEYCPTGALELCGTDMNIIDIIDLVKKDLPFYGKDGGITVSGGEPFAQANNMLMLLSNCKKEGISTVVETCGYGDRMAFISSVQYVDLYLWDIKDTNDKRHFQSTGASNETIIENLRAVDAIGGKNRLRCILVNGINTDEEHYRKVAELALSLFHCEGVEWLPYHAYGGVKLAALGFEDNGNVDWIPTPEQLEMAKRVVSEYGVRVF